MSDFARAMEIGRAYDAFVAAIGGCGDTSTTVSITNTSTAATLSAAPSELRANQIYLISATGIPANTTFRYAGSTAITLSAAATATNATAAATIKPSLIGT